MSVKSRFTILAFTSLFALALPSTVKAGDNGLYAAAPPPGSAFVRFACGTCSQPEKGTIRGKNAPAVSAGQVGPYVAVSQGDAAITLGGASMNYNLKPGGHYAAVLTGGKLNILEEPLNDNNLKTQIVLLNLSNEKDVSLKTADGSVSVINDVDPGKLGARPVNAVKVGFSVYAGDKKIGSVPDQSLERGTGYTVIVYDGAKGPAVNYGKATGS